jgi:hypothetical protein
VLYIQYNYTNNLTLLAATECHPSLYLAPAISPSAPFRAAPPNQLSRHLPPGGRQERGTLHPSTIIIHHKQNHLHPLPRPDNQYNHTITQSLPLPRHRRRRLPDSTPSPHHSPPLNTPGISFLLRNRVHARSLVDPRLLFLSSPSPRRRQLPVNA